MLHIQTSAPTGSSFNKLGKFIELGFLQALFAAFLRTISHSGGDNSCCLNVNRLVNKDLANFFTSLATALT